MKYCPNCREIYDEAQRFCERDGASLRPIAAAGARTHAPRTRPGAAGRSYTSSHLVGVGAIGVVVGIVVVMTAMMGAFTLTRNGADETRSSHESDAPVVLRESRSAPPAPRAATSTIPLYERVEPTPSPEPSPSAEDEADEARDSAVVSPAPVKPSAESASRENTGPDDSRGEGAVIRLKDGATIEADDVWADRYGFWYRRGGLVARVERARIASVVRRPLARAEPSEPAAEEKESAEAGTPALRIVEP